MICAMLFVACFFFSHLLFSGKFSGKFSNLKDVPIKYYLFFICWELILWLCYLTIDSNLGVYSVFRLFALLFWLTTIIVLVIYLMYITKNNEVRAIIILTLFISYFAVHSFTEQQNKQYESLMCDFEELEDKNEKLKGIVKKCKSKIKKQKEEIENYESKLENINNLIDNISFQTLMNKGASYSDINDALDEIDFAVDDIQDELFDW